MVTRGHSDDCNSFTVDGDSVWLRVSRTGRAFAFHASLDGERWTFVRLFTLGEEEESGAALVGFLVQAPTGRGARRRSTGWSSGRRGPPTCATAADGTGTSRSSVLGSMIDERVTGCRVIRTVLPAEAEAVAALHARARATYYPDGLPDDGTDWPAAWRTAVERPDGQVLAVVERGA